MDLELRVPSCLRCGNEDFSDTAGFCKKCGAPLYNYCDNRECAQLNVIDAVYCEHCGCRTIFTEVNLLEDPYPPEEVAYNPEDVPF